MNVETPQQEDIANPAEGEAPKLSDTILLTSAQVSRWVFRLIFALLAARSLGPEKFGVYALLFTVTEFLAVASGSGYADYLTRETAKDERLGWGIAAQLVLLRIAIAIPIAAIEIALLGILKYSHVTLIAACAIALTIVPRSISEAVQGVLRGVRKYRAYLLVEMFLGGSLLAGGVMFVFLHGGLRMAIQAELAAASVGAIAALVSALKFRTKTSLHLSFRRLVSTSAIFNAYSFIGALYDRFDVVLLSRLAGDYSTAIYSVAYRVVSATQILAYGVLYSLLPDLSRGEFGRAGQRRLDEALGLLMGAGFFQVMAVMVFAGPVIQLVLGARYAESAVVLKILIWAAIPRYINYAFNIALLAAGHERVFMATSLVSLVVNVGGNLLLIPRFGWRAAAGLTVATEFVLLAQNAYWVRRLLGRLPRPTGIVRTSIAFLVLFAIFTAGERVGSPLLVGAACLLFFLMHLYRAGFLTQVAAVWDSGESTAV